MITTIDQEIISKLKDGLSPAEISISYKKEGQDIPSSYVRHVKMLLNADMLCLLEEDIDIDSETKIASTITTSRQYAEMRRKQQL